MVQFLVLASLNCHLVPHFQLGLDALVAWLALFFVVQVPAQLSCHRVALYWINLCVFPYHHVKVPQFSDTSLKNNNQSLLLWCTCPVKSSRDPWPLWEVPTYRPSEPLCNTTYPWQGPSGCSIGAARCCSLSHTWAVTLPEVAPSLLKNLKWPHNLSGIWTTLSYAASRLRPATGQALPGRTSLVCRRVPTQDAFWYLPRNCDLLGEAVHCAHSRGILIFAVGLLPISIVHSLCPLKRHTDICCGIATYIASPCTVPTQETYWYLLWYCYWFFLQAHSMLHSSGTCVSCVDFLSLL